MEYQIPARHLAAAITHAASPSDIRFYLHTVLFDFERGALVATDGHRMFCGQIPTMNDQKPLIVPLRVARAVIKESGKTATLTLDITGKHPQRKIFFDNGYVVFAGTEMDAIFPDWSTIIPEKPSGQLAQFNARYLYEASKALRAYHGIGPTKTERSKLMHNGSSAAVMRLIGFDEAFCLIMPLSVSDTSAFEPFCGVGPRP